MEGIVPQGAGPKITYSLDCTGNVTVVMGAREGPEKGSLPKKLAEGPRVSTRRQGVIAMNVRASVDT